MAIANVMIPNKNLEAARMRKRWSLAVASEKVGVSSNTFNRWERGLQVPQLDRLDQLCKAFELSPEELGFGHVVVPKQRPQLSSPKGTFISHPGQPSLLITSTTHYTPKEQPVGLIQRETMEQDLSACFEQARRSLESMSQVWKLEDGGERQEVSRRQAIASLVGVPAAVLGVARNGKEPLLHPEEVLSLCEVSIPLCWQLYFEGGLAETERILPGYLTRLRELPGPSSRHTARAAALLSQGYQLASLLALQHQNFGSANVYAQQAFEFGGIAEDANLQVGSLIRQAQVYFYLKRASARLHTYERALQSIDRVSPLFQGRVYIGLTEAHGALGHAREARSFLDLAHRTFPAQCEADPHFSYTHFNHWSLSSFEGLTYLHLKQPGKAWELLHQVEKIVPDSPAPNRLELMVRQALVYLDLEEKEQACATVRAAATTARAVGNQLRYDEAFVAYERMSNRWGRERDVQELAELFL